MNKKTKIAIFTVAGFLVLLLAVWGLCETAGSEHYNYAGYVVDVQTANGTTVITTLSGDQVSEFRTAWYTKENFGDRNNTLNTGDYIMLTTVRNRDRIKKFSVYEGYSIEGKIVHVAGLQSPFILTTDETTKAFHFYSLITANSGAKAPEDGAPVKVYYQFPVPIGSITIVADIIQPTGGEVQTLTQEEIAYITSQGYRLPEK